MMINNETGIVQPVFEIGEKLKELQNRRKIHFHVDAVQSACKYNFNIQDMGADSVTISSHKFQGPRGCGLLYLNKEIETIYHGGGQEGSLRSGTENIFGIAGSFFAAEKAMEKLDNNLSYALKFKEVMINKLSKIPGLAFNPSISIDKMLDTTKVSPYILSLSIKPIPAEILVRVMSDRGFSVSTGAACSTGKNTKSRVLESFGLSKEAAYSTIRISTGATTKYEDIVSFCDAFKEEVFNLQRSLII